jgi:HEAT repeat protein
MKPRRRTIKICFHIIFLSVLALSSVQAAEPVYDGKALSEWLVALHANPSDEEVIAATKQNLDPAKLVAQKQNLAQEAIRQIGTNGLPTLLDLVSVGEGNRRHVARRIKSQDIQKCLRESKPDFREAVREMAVEGFRILGTNAEPAIPQLTKLLHGDSEGLLEVANTLAQMGPKGFAVLTNEVNGDLDGILVLAIGQKGGSDVQAVTRFLIAALQSSSPVTRGNAAEYLAGKDASLAVPALIRVLDDPQDYAWRGAAIALGSYGSAAKDAVPKLFSLYTNHLDVFVMGALTSIDREAAGRAEEFLVNSGPLNAARRGYSRTKLTNGMELIAGGVMDTQIIAMTNHFLASAQLLDPKTGKWTETGKMNTARFDHKATLLRNGKVLVEGGNGAPAIPGRFPPSLSSSELYDPSTGIWTVVTNK